MTTCLISGITSGIGYALGLSLLKDGCHVIGIGRNTEKLEAIGKEFPGLFTPVALDLEDVEGIKGALAAHLQDVDCFVHCAGVSMPVPLRKMLYSRNLMQMNVNFFSFVEIVRLLLAKKEDWRSLRIVAMSSVASIEGKGGNPIYSAGKAALDGFVRGISHELGDKKVEINTLQPVFVDTEMIADVKTFYGEGFDSFIRDYQPQGVVPVEDIVEEIRFLLEKRGSKVTGTARYINSGRA